MNLRAEGFTINHKAKLNRNDWIKALLPSGMKCQLHQLQWSWIKLNSWCGIQTNDIWKIQQHQCRWCSGRTASTGHNVYWGNDPKAEWTKAAPPHKAHFNPEWNLSTSQYDANQHWCSFWKISESGVCITSESLGCTLTLMPKLKHKCKLGIKVFKDYIVEPTVKQTSLFWDGNYLEWELCSEKNKKKNWI